MPPNPDTTDTTSLRPRRRLLRARRPRLDARPVIASTLVVLLVACANLPGNRADDAAQRAQAERVAAQSVAACPVPEPQKPAACLPAESDHAVQDVLAYADRVRLVPPGDLGQEIARLGDASQPQSPPVTQMQLAVALAQLRQLPDLIRAQELLARVLGNPGDEAKSLHPLARMLAARYGEQRRVEEQLDKQNQQVRDVQRRLDQTNERLEALKAIERSLGSRLPAAAASAPAAAPRRPATP